MFNIRVYGICIEEDAVLTVTESVGGKQIRKFPGGGLEFGEGILDCLIREFEEELGWKPEHIRHFYTTEFFVESMLNPEHQIISIYYFVQKPLHTKHRELDGHLQFEWIPISRMNTDLFPLPIDKHVVNMLLTKEQKNSRDH